MQKRTQIINFLIEKINAKNYLEIGLGNAKNFSQVICENKTSVDQYDENFRKNTLKWDTLDGVEPTYLMSSDDFFKQNNQKFDVCFIDGKHDQDFVKRDLENCLNVTHNGGYVLLHDLNPKIEAHQRVPQETPMWLGDCWKTWVRTRSDRDDLEMYVINVETGIGVVKKGSQEKLDLSNCYLNFQSFQRNRKKWLNLISEIEFFDKEGLNNYSI